MDCVKLAFLGAGTQAFTEPPMILFTVLGLWLLWLGVTRRREAYLPLAGLACAAAVTFKQIAVLDFAAALVFVALSGDLLAGRRLRYALLLVAGCGAGLLALGAVMVATHQWPQFWESAVTTLTSGASSMSASGRGERMADLLLRAPWRLPLALALAAGLAPLAPGLRPLRRLGLIWLGFTFAGFIGSGYASTHQTLPFLPPLCLLLGLGCVWLGGMPRARWARLTLVPLALLVIWSQPLLGYESRIKARLHAQATEPASYLQPLGRRLDQRLPPGATIYTAGRDTVLYRLAGRRSASRYPYPGWNSEAINRTILGDLEQARPAAIIVTPSLYPPEQVFLEALRAWPGLREYRLAPRPVPGEYELYLRITDSYRG